jgi:hypothetical protein
MIKKLIFLCLLTKLYPVYSFDIEQQLHAVTENIFKMQSLCINLQSAKVTDVQNLDIKMLKITLLETKGLLNDLKNIVIGTDSKVHVGAPFMIILCMTIEQTLLLDFESQHPYIIDNTFFSINTIPDILYNLTALFSLFPLEEESSWYVLPKKEARVFQDFNLNKNFFSDLEKYSHDYIENMRSIFSNYSFLYLTDAIHKLADREKIFLTNWANELINYSSILYSDVNNTKYEIIHISAPIVHVLHNILVANLSNVTNLDRITQNKIEYLFIALMLTLKYYPFYEAKSWRVSYYNFL